jgi:hypothetical protein
MRCKSYALRASRLHSRDGVQMRSVAKLLERQASRLGVVEVGGGAPKASRLHSRDGVQMRSEAKLLEQEASRLGVGGAAKASRCALRVCTPAAESKCVAKRSFWNGWASRLSQVGLGGGVAKASRCALRVFTPGVKFYLCGRFHLGIRFSNLAAAALGSLTL